MLLLLEWSWCPHVRILFLSTPLSINTWTYFLISDFAWGQARSKLGGVDMSYSGNMLWYHYSLVNCMFVKKILSWASNMSCDTSILHHAFILIFIALWAVIIRYVTLIMPILSYFTRFTRRGRMSAARILGWKGANIRDLFCTTPKVLKLHGTPYNK